MNNNNNAFLYYYFVDSLQYEYNIYIFYDENMYSAHFGTVTFT